MRSTTQMGGGQFDPPPTHVDSVVSVGKRLNQITCDFFFLEKKLSGNEFGSLIFFVGPNFDLFPAFLEKTTPLPEEGLHILANNSKRLGRELKM